MGESRISTVAVDDRGHRGALVAPRRMTRGRRRSDRATFQSRAADAQTELAGRGVLSHFTAAKVLRGVVPDHASIHVTSRSPIRVRRTGMVAHRTRRAFDVVEVGGLRVTTAERTFMDLAPMMDLVSLVVLGDSLVRRGWTTPDRLRTAARQWRGSGVGLARRAAHLVRERVDSPRETLVRLLMVLAGLPEPTVDHRILDSRGELLYRLDLAYEKVRLGIEFDGRHHANSDDQWLHDLERREDLDGRRWRLVVIVGKHLFTQPEDVLDRIVAAARSQGMSLPIPTSEWRPHFGVTNR